MRPNRRRLTTQTHRDIRVVGSLTYVGSTIRNMTALFQFCRHRMSANQQARFMAPVLIRKGVLCWCNAIRAADPTRRIFRAASIYSTLEGTQLSAIDLGAAAMAFGGSSDGTSRRRLPDLRHAQPYRVWQIARSTASMSTVNLTIHATCPFARSALGSVSLKASRWTIR